MFIFVRFERNRKKADHIKKKKKKKKKTSKGLYFLHFHFWTCNPRIGRNHPIVHSASFLLHFHYCRHHCSNISVKEDKEEEDKENVAVRRTKE